MSTAEDEEEAECLQKTLSLESSTCGFQSCLVELDMNESLIGAIAKRET